METKTKHGKCESCKSIEELYPVDWHNVWNQEAGGLRYEATWFCKGCKQTHEKETQR